ncbi:NAD(P)-binding protein [Aureobasidium pullulans]|uniref:NAD(P)-binding protein n=1 Tax=Aureobasidium pullulans TaxID=5580 RepID=A0A4V6T7D0_AURPU|nr:NAD(P)-binding protein [Aureobasidium pullulans]THZ66052.1 NAD(P)-binding protein [Aureobasidium pullulans]
MAPNTILFLGAGGNIGASSVKLFKSKGYKVASVARTIRKEVAEHSDLVMTADFSDPTTIKGIFETVEREIGVPNVVIYNPYSWSIGTDPSNPLSTPIEGVQKDLAINTVSAYAVAQAAVETFDKLPSDVKKTFIYTGNTSNTAIVPMALLLGLTKSSTWYMIQSVVATPRSISAGYHFYCVVERTPAGKAMYGIPGPGHAEFFLEDQGEALTTLVRGKGYTRSEGNGAAILPVRAMEDVVDAGYGLPGTVEAEYGS